MKTPQYKTITLAAGANAQVSLRGGYVTILSVSASTVLLGIDDETPQQIISGLHIPAQGQFTHLRFMNIGGVAATVIFYVSDSQILDFRQSALSAAIANSLASIDADTDDLSDLPEVLAQLQGDVTPENWDTEITLVAATAEEVLASNTDRKGCVVQAKSTNTDPVYIGFGDTVTDSKWVLELKPGQGYTWDNYRGPIWAYSDAGGDIVGFGEW